MSCIRCIVVIIVCKIHVMLVLACQCWANTPSSGGWWWLLIGTFSGTGILGALTIICLGQCWGSLGLVWGEVSVVTSERLYLYGQASQYLPMYCVQTRPGQARGGNSNGPAAGKHPAVRLHQETLLTLSGVSWQSWQSSRPSGHHSHL